jgi:hypothetical protein
LTLLHSNPFSRLVAEDDVEDDILSCLQLYKQLCKKPRHNLDERHGTKVLLFYKSAVRKLEDLSRQTVACLRSGHFWLVPTARAYWGDEIMR